MNANPATSPAPTTLADPTCPITVPHPSMFHRWDDLTFLHWPYDPDVVQRLVPPGLEVETFDGVAWVALVPFRMEVRAPAGPAIPWISHFPETNVRTYVVAPDGTRGVWFLSLDATRLPAVLTARVGYRLPYFWSSMRIERHGAELTYTTRRRWPDPSGVRSRVRVRVGATFAPGELGDLDHRLTARWRLYSHHPAAQRRYALAEHEPWPLHRAELLDLDDELVAATGLPAPTGEPMVHWSPGVAVRIGLPHRLSGR